MINGGFVHLHCHSPFSFLDGASKIETLVAQAAMWEMPAMALTDYNTIAGLPEFHKWAAVYGIKPISGAEVTLEDGTHLTLLAENQEGYKHLCECLTLAHSGGDGRVNPRLPERQLFARSAGLVVLSGCRKGLVAQHLLNHQPNEALAVAKKYWDAFHGSYFLEIQNDFYPRTDWLNRRLQELSEYLSVPLVATGNVHHSTKQEFPVYDVLSCIRHRIDIYTPSSHRPLNDAHFLYSAKEAQFRFERYPQALSNAMAIAERCQPVLQTGTTWFPEYRLPPRRDAGHYLRELVYEGARQRYGTLDAVTSQRLDYELNIIEQLGYVDYFLVVWDIVRFAREHRIRCAGRGSAADSAVAYCLYITDVDAAGRGLLFERFMSLERAEKPDIDIDFDSRRRDEVMDYVYRTYGENHVARIATLQTFRGRSAIREIGSALAIPAEVLDKIAKRVPAMAHSDDLQALFQRVPEMKGFSQYEKQLPWLWKLAAQVAGYPRHFGMHVGGLIIASRPLYEVTSLQPSAKGEWMTPFDKHAVEEVGLVKLDLLSLRTMSAVEDTVVLRERQGHALDYDRIPLEDESTFAMIARGETIGVFQLESPAQRALQTRLKPTGLEDIVASVALIRPGPIKGNMVDPFVHRRHGVEKISYLHPKLEPILGKTYGVVLFQEQVIEIATVIANFTPGEADELRRVMSHARSSAEMNRIGQRFLEKASECGVDEDTASTIFSYIQGYASYGFCEAHAAAFATTAYKTAYLAHYYPAEFFAAILNQYPMGYYPVHVVCAAARQRNIEIVGLDVNRSRWQSLVEGNKIYLGFSLLKGFRQDLAEKLALERDGYGAFQSVEDCIRRVPSLDRLSAERMVRVGAFDALAGTLRRDLLWQLPQWFARRTDKLPLFDQGVCTPEGNANREHKAHIRQVDVRRENDIETNAQRQESEQLIQNLVDEYNLMGVGVSGHWLDILRPFLQSPQYLTAKEVQASAHGTRLQTAGLVVRPHRPPTRSGRTTVFFTLEDETGFVDATMFEDVYQSRGAVLFTPYGRLVGVRGTVQCRDGSHPQLVVSDIWSLQEN